MHSSGFTMMKISIPSLMLVLTCTQVTGCARLMAAASGPDPVGVPEGERTLSQRVEDLSIERTAAINLYKLHPDFGRSRVVVMSFYGNVLLTGQVPSAGLKQMAGDSVAGLREVGTVHNELAVSETPLPYMVRARDSIISARVRTALTLAKGFPGSQSKITVENGVVYLMAKLTRKKAEQAVGLISPIPDVRRIVKLVDYLPDN